MHLRSDSFSPYDFFPARLCFGTHDPESHIALAGNRNPHLAWDGAPEGTKSFVILCVDVDVPSAGDDVNQEGKRVPLNLPRVDFFHWVLCDLPASVTEIAEGTHSAVRICLAARVAQCDALPCRGQHVRGCCVV